MEFIRCYGCMGELSAPGARCPRCGYDNTNDPYRQPSHVLPCGTVLGGRYVLGRSLGQGGFGITYIGYDLKLELRVCIKEYFPEGAAMRSAVQSCLVYWGSSETAQSFKQSRESFVREAQKAVRLRGLSSVVKVWDVFYENETAYIVMDYIEGETLKSNIVRTNRTLGERKCFELLAPVMADLEKAHGLGIIHRDIKPDNLMLTPNGELVLLDMGAAKDLEGSAGNGSRPSSTLVVSHGFSPKEQYRSKGNIGPWTDVYAMCATMYFCVSGRVPPSALDRDEGDDIDLHVFSPAVANVLRKGLALRTVDRIQTMGELHSALAAALAAKSQTVPGPEYRPEWDTPAQKPEPKPKPWLWPALAAVVLAFAIGYFVSGNGISSPAVSSAPTAAAQKKTSPTQSTVTESPKRMTTPTPTPAPKPTPSPTPKPTPTPRRPGPDDIKGCNEDVVYPRSDSWLSSYETKYLKTKHGVRAYLRYDATEDAGYYAYVYEADSVTVLARQNGYSLVKTNDGMAGWVTSSLLVDKYS